jgi:hypothetical protein
VVREGVDDEPVSLDEVYDLLKVLTDYVVKVSSALKSPDLLTAMTTLIAFLTLVVTILKK